jgi:hypothetical protein
MCRSCQGEHDASTTRLHLDRADMTPLAWQVFGVSAQAVARCFALRFVRLTFLSSTLSVELRRDEPVAAIAPEADLRGALLARRRTRR